MLWWNWLVVGIAAGIIYLIIAILVSKLWFRNDAEIERWKYIIVGVIWPIVLIIMGFQTLGVFGKWLNEKV